MATESEHNSLLEFFRCPDWFGDTELRLILGDDLAARISSGWSHDPYWRDVHGKHLSTSTIYALIEGLRRERYQQATTDTSLGAIAIRELYYLLRPLLGVKIRRHLQKAALRGWDARPFPKWPIDRTVDELNELVFAATMQHKSVDRAPFIWFWPDGYSSCLIMTHDVEENAGLRFCDTLMDMDDLAGIKSSFQLIPELRYRVTRDDLDRIKARGFEVNVHDLNHDGHLFRDENTFLRRVGEINKYGREYGSKGFRSGALYRNQEWYGSFDFAYDMSVPNVAHLDPQHGGCCTIFPYFVGELLELPVTAIQDYSLFHVLGQYSIDLWRRQVQEIVDHNGLINIIAHPDYLIEAKARETYSELLCFLSEFAKERGIWIATPNQVNEWWRQRSRMALSWSGDGWIIAGEGSERAVLAHAQQENQRLIYSIGDRCTGAAGSDESIDGDRDVSLKGVVPNMRLA